MPTKKTFNPKNLLAVVEKLWIYQILPASRDPETFLVGLEEREQSLGVLPKGPRGKDGTAYAHNVIASDHISGLYKGPLLAVLVAGEFVEELDGLLRTQEFGATVIVRREIDPTFQPDFRLVHVAAGPLAPTSRDDVRLLPTALVAYSKSIERFRVYAEEYHHL